MIRPTTWAHVEPGMTVIARDGRPRLIRAAQNYYDAYRAWVSITDADGTYELDPDGPALVLEVSDMEAVVNLLVTFPGSEIIETTGDR